MEKNAGFAILNQDGEPEGAIKCSFKGNVQAFALDAQDNIYALASEVRDGKGSQTLEVVSPAGDILKTIDLGPYSSGGTVSGKNAVMLGSGYMDIAVDSAGNIYLADAAKGVLMLDKDGRQLKTLGSQGYESIDIDTDGGIIAKSLGMGKNSIEKLDASTGKSIWSIDLQRNTNGVISIGSNKVRVSKADKCIYCMDGQTITKYDSSGKSAGVAVDFKSYTILASGYNISDMFTDASGNIYVTTTSVPAGGAGLKTMPGSAGANPEPAGEGQSGSAANGSSTGAGNDQSGETMVKGATDGAEAPGGPADVFPGGNKVRIVQVFGKQRGTAKPNKKSSPSQFPDPTGRLKWPRPDSRRRTPDTGSIYRPTRIRTTAAATTIHM